VIVHPNSSETPTAARELITRGWYGSGREINQAKP
jgi:hypothetical protein